MERCNHCGHPTRHHTLWGGDRDTRDVLSATTRFCHDCTHGTCRYAVELAGVRDGLGVG